MPSSVILRMNYNPGSQSLVIHFVSGAIYKYKKVPKKVFVELKAASSKGVYFNHYIKGIYKFEKIMNSG